jgi:hypothetical protein
MEAVAARSKVVGKGSTFLEQPREGQKQGLGSLNGRQRRRKDPVMKPWESTEEGEIQPTAVAELSRLAATKKRIIGRGMGESLFLVLSLCRNFLAEPKNAPRQNFARN